MTELDALLALAIKLSKEAGEEVLRHYDNGEFKQYTKGDNSPVTTADLAANRVLEEQLAIATPDIPIISEESGILPLAQRQHWPRYWLLDPIDGTGEFILGSGDFAVNIALIENNHPVIGVIHAPYHQLTYFAAQGQGAFKESPLGKKSIKVACFDGQREINVAISRRQELKVIDQYMAQRYQYHHIALGSCSLKNCLVAEGKADCYIRIGPTGEWDTGASQCIVEQAGGQILDSQFRPLSYNQHESLANPNFMALGASDIDWQQIIDSHESIGK
jgi:3'(2'), 5'-bisphosphate nucleotidase